VRELNWPNGSYEPVNLSKTKISAAAFWVGFLGISAGCATSPTVSRAPNCPVSPVQQVGDYRISPGDVLQVFVWRNPELTVTVPVRPDGRISTPLVDDIQASGKTPAELSTEIEAVLGELVRTPEVNIIVSAQGPGNQIRVVGEVVAPQSVPHREGIHLLDVLVAVGGLNEFAAGNRSKILRTVDGASVECEVRINDLMQGEVSQDVALFPGDAVVVPEARF
jgi:polysaccharide biosynthesis/export protein